MSTEHDLQKRRGDNPKQDMPRLTFANYRERYKLLRKTWGESPGVLMYLQPNDQWDLFDYFKFHEERSEEELKAQWASLGSYGL